MRKIDKTKILSTAYKKWEEGLEKEGKPHPKWKSDGRYYLDLVMNLFHCQDGLCAYTESLLCSPEHIGIEKWNEGRYTSERPQFGGDVEHFDETLKAKKEDAEGRKDWLWDNLFMVQSNVNSRIKSTKTVDYILKPDSPDYDPFHFLEYNSKSHVYFANTDLEEDLQKRINDMILALGLNYDPIREERKNVLNERMMGIRFGAFQLDKPIHAYPTALEFCKRNELAEGN